jgi:ferredoxin
MIDNHTVGLIYYLRQKSRKKTFWEEVNYMAMRITDECTACGLCLPECPQSAISEGDIYVIDPDKCNECEGVEGGSKCVAICPVECIEKAN